MASKPSKFKTIARLMLKKGYFGAPEANTVADRRIKLTCCVGETFAEQFVDEELFHGKEGEATKTESGEEKMDAFPPLMETPYAPVLPAVFANMFLKEETRPHSAHLLYVCVEPKAEQDLALKIEIIFRDESDDPQGEDTKRLRQTYSFDFDKQRTSPDEEHYLVFLFISGESARSAEFEFEEIEVIDVSDDSPHGFPDSLKLWVDGYDAEAQTLVFVEMSPEMEIVDDSEDDLDEEDIAQDPSQIPPEPDDSPWRAGEGSDWLS